MSVGTMKKVRDDGVLAKVFNDIAKKSGGVLTPQAVVDFARDPSSPAHGYFEWDDEKAGEQYRLIQAYKLLAAQRKFRVVTDPSAMPILKEASKAVELRKYLSTRTGENHLVEREAAKNDPAIRARTVEAFRGELRAWVRRTADFEELHDLHLAIEDLLG